MSDASKKSPASQQDRVAAETLIRTSVLALANGAPIGDLDEVIRRNASNVSHEDVMAGRLNTSVIGDIINTVEQAKGSKPFNWTSATQAQIAAYIVANGIKLPGYGPDGLPRAPEVKAEGATVGRTPLADAGSVTPQNYSGTQFATTGLSYDNFTALKSRGFSDSNIIHAAQDMRANGFDVNNKKINGAFAVLDKDDGKRRDERNVLLNKLDGRLEHDAEFQRLQGLRDKAVGQERAALEQQMIARGKEVSKESGWRKHIDAAPTPAARDAGETLEGEKIKLKGAIGEYSHGKKATIDKVNETVAKARRNPNDASAWKDYSVLPQHATNSRMAAGAAEIVKEMDKAERLSAKKLAQNEDKKKKLASKDADADDLVASMIGPDPTKKASNEVEIPRVKKTESSAPSTKDAAELDVHKISVEKSGHSGDKKPSVNPSQKMRLAGSPSMSA